MHCHSPSQKLKSCWPCSPSICFLYLFKAGLYLLKKKNQSRTVDATLLKWPSHNEHQKKKIPTFSLFCSIPSITLRVSAISTFSLPSFFSGVAFLSFFYLKPAKLAAHLAICNWHCSPFFENNLLRFYSITPGSAELRTTTKSSTKLGRGSTQT